MTRGEAAIVLGVSVEEIQRLQSEGKLPDPIPDDFLDPVVKFRIDLENAHRRKMDKFSQGGRDAQD